MPTPDYTNPPVHEVVVSLAFDSVATTAETFVTRATEEAWPTNLVELRFLDDAQVLGRMTPSGATMWQTRVGRVGVARTDQAGENTTRALQLRPDIASYHVVRPHPWPQGPYAGWSRIAAELVTLRPSLERLYRGGRITRLALRYLNRIAVPALSSLDQWLAVGIYGPPGLESPSTFTMRQQWEQLGTGSEFGASLGLYPIDIEDPAHREGNLGVLLDIEVSRPNEDNGMTWATIEACFARAHEAHGAMFEACLSDALRATFRGEFTNAPLLDGAT